MEQFDLIVIGSGPGGYPAAIRAAQLGARTAIIEREHVGGTCLNIGCIPTKTLIAGAEMYRHIREAERFGIQVGEVSFDYAAMKLRKDKVVAQLGQGVAQLLKANMVTLLQGQAALEARNRVVIDNADGSRTRVKADKIVIATGSTSVMPGFLPRHEKVMDSRAFLDLDKLPASMIVVGGGYIGSELACLAAAFGVKVTVVELLEDILLLLDRDARREVRKSMNNMGIEILTGHALENIEAAESGVSGTHDGQSLCAECLLAAIGRRPVTNGLHPERAGLTLNNKGAIEVDEYGQTATSGIYAVGDVNGRMQLAHVATSQAVYAVEHALGHSRRPHETVIPGVIFTMPEVAVVGLTEAEAEAQGRDVHLGKYHFRGLGKALAANESDGFVKWLADAQSGLLLGAQAVGPHATDLIAEACVAIRAELTATELGHTIHAHPTFAEIWMEAAHDVEGACIHAVKPRKRS